MILGIGTGDPIDEPEHRVFGIEYLGKAERREHLVETVRAIKALYAGVRWEGGSHVPAMTGPLLPPPVRPGRSPDLDRRVRRRGRAPRGRRGRRVERLGDGGRRVHSQGSAAARDRGGPAGLGDVGGDRRRRARRRRRSIACSTSGRARGLEPGVWSGTTASLRHPARGARGGRRDLVGARPRRSARPARRDRRRGPPARSGRRRERSPGPPAEAGQARAAPRDPRRTRRAPRGRAVRAQRGDRRPVPRAPRGGRRRDGAGVLVVRQRGRHGAADRAPAFARARPSRCRGSRAARSSPSSRRPARR